VEWEQALTFAFLGLGVAFLSLAFKAIWDTITGKKE